MNFRVWPLLVAGLASGAQLESTILTFYDQYELQSDTSYVQPTHSKSLSECSSVCHRGASAGLHYNKTTRECVIFPTAESVVRGAGVYIRDGWLVELLAARGYIKIGSRFVLPMKSNTRFSDTQAECAQFFAFGTIFVPKSGEEMTLLSANLEEDLYDTDMWIGLDDIEQEGTPVWADGTPYTGLESLKPMNWKDKEQAGNTDNNDGVVIKWKKGDKYWETKFKDANKGEGVLCQVELYKI